MDCVSKLRVVAVNKIMHWQIRVGRLYPLFCCYIILFDTFRTTCYVTVVVSLNMELLVKKKTQMKWLSKFLDNLLSRKSFIACFDCVKILVIHRSGKVLCQNRYFQLKKLWLLLSVIFATSHTESRHLRSFFSLRNLMSSIC